MQLFYNMSLLSSFKLFVFTSRCLSGWLYRCLKPVQILIYVFRIAIKSESSRTISYNFTNVQREL